eukprot:GHVS01018801.1.p1 GENE.GHVS01018801.1~~GHVS01018801.1.p1  ORF type:complete len:801 (+),score=242.94 GHVS01018801.1:619-3021(+)
MSTFAILPSSTSCRPTTTSITVDHHHLSTISSIQSSGTISGPPLRPFCSSLLTTTGSIAYYNNPQHISSHPPPPQMSSSLHHHHVISSAPPPAPSSYLVQQTAPSFSCSNSTDASPRTKKRLTYSRYYRAATTAESRQQFSCQQHRLLAAQHGGGGRSSSSRELSGSCCDASGGGTTTSGMLVGMQLSFSHGKIQPTPSTPTPHHPPSHTTPTSSLSSTATPSTSSPSTDSSTTPARQPLVGTSGFSTTQLLTQHCATTTTSRNNNHWRSSTTGEQQHIRVAGGVGVQQQQQADNKLLYSSTIQQQQQHNNRHNTNTQQELSVSSAAACSNHHPTLREVNPQPPLFSSCSSDCRYIPAPLASTAAVSQQPNNNSYTDNQRSPHATTFVSGVVGGGWQTRTTTRGDGRSTCTYGSGCGGGGDQKQQGMFMCECLARHRGGADGGGEARVRASVIGRCQTATTTTRVVSGCRSTTAQTTAQTTTSAGTKSLCGGGGRLVSGGCNMGMITAAPAGLVIEATTTTTTNGSGSGGTMSRVCTETSEEELSGVSTTGSVISCITTTGSSGGLISGVGAAIYSSSGTTSIMTSTSDSNTTGEAMAFLKYKIGHMSPTLVLVCFNFAELCWHRFRNMDILGAVELIPAPSGSTPSSMSENTNANSKPSTRLALSKAAALLIAFLARYRLHEDDIVAVLCTAYSYLQAMDTPTLQPLVRQMVLWFYPSNILYFLAFLAHIHVLDDTIPLKCWGQRLSEGVAKGSNVNKCVRNLLRMMKYRLEVDLESYGQSYHTLHTHNKQQYSPAVVV